MKVIFSKFQKPFPLHFPQLCRQRRPVHTQLVGELLAIEWDIKSLALIFYRLIGEVRQKPSPDGFRRCIEDPAGQLQVFLRRDCKQVADKLRVMSARIGTLRQHFSTFKNSTSVTSAANTSTSSFSPGTHAYVSAKICPGSTRSRMLRLPHRSSLTIITLPCITTPRDVTVFPAR